MFKLFKKRTKYVVRSFHSNDGWVRVDVLHHPEAGWAVEIFVDVCGEQQHSVGIVQASDLFCVAYAMREAGFFIKKHQQ